MLFAQAAVSETDPQRRLLLAVLTASEHPASCLCDLFVDQEASQSQNASDPGTTVQLGKGKYKAKAKPRAGQASTKAKEDDDATWAAMRLLATETLVVMCESSRMVARTIASSRMVTCLTKGLRYV